MEYLGPITGLIGTLGGLAISIISILHSYSLKKPSIKIEIHEGQLFNFPNVDSTVNQLIISMSNRSEVEYKVSNIGISIGRRTGSLAIPYPVGSHQIPVLLKKGDSCTFWTPYEDLKSTVRNSTKRNSIKIRARVSDFTGTRYKSNWLPITFKITKLRKLKVKIKKQFRDDIKLIFP